MAIGAGSAVLRLGLEGGTDLSLTRVMTSEESDGGAGMEENCRCASEQCRAALLYRLENSQNAGDDLC